MTDLAFHFGNRTTSIKVEQNILDRVGDEMSRVFSPKDAGRAVVITDETVGGLHADRVGGSLAAAGFTVLERRIAPGEASKSLTVAADLYAFLAEQAVTRESVLLALGGGVVSDLAGFVAATWMRGIRFAICPTTLEADVDACLGGKTGVNIAAGKNLVGAFHPSDLIAIDPMCLGTLDLRDVRAGMAESIKHAMISSEAFAAWHSEHAEAILRLDADTLTDLIQRNLRIKGDIVERDPLEQRGPRAHLNFGHTFGHAIESVCGYSLRHGECVALGLVAACRLSNILGILDAGTVAHAVELLSLFELPTQLPHFVDTDAVVERIRVDKKARGGAVRMVLLEAIGRPVIRADVTEDALRAAFETLSEYGA